jgi:hypothetical protein
MAVSPEAIEAQKRAQSNILTYKLLWTKGKGFRAIMRSNRVAFPEDTDLEQVKVFASAPGERDEQKAHAREYNRRAREVNERNEAARTSRSRSRSPAPGARPNKKQRGGGSSS